VKHVNVVDDRIDRFGTGFELIKDVRENNEYDQKAFYVVPIQTSVVTGQSGAAHMYLSDYPFLYAFITVFNLHIIAR
jgi:hypothetical protein